MKRLRIFTFKINVSLNLPNIDRGIQCLIYHFVLTWIQAATLDRQKMFMLIQCQRPFDLVSIEALVGQVLKS